jgi:hypothetical protein
MKEYGRKVETISGRYSTFYPSKLITDKIAIPDTDISLAKKLGIYCLGDKSGSGVILRSNKDINRYVLEYLMTPESEGVEAFDLWRKVIKDNFKPEFIKLEI